MNFDLDDTPQEIRSLAPGGFRRGAVPSRLGGGGGRPERLYRGVWAGRAPGARLEAVEASPDRFDRELWSELARVGLLGVAVAEAYDGLGLGLVELSLVCEQLGRAVAPVPYVATACAGLVLATHGSAELQQEW